jgi:CBS domain containing-hemolysin-like protein
MSDIEGIIWLVVLLAANAFFVGAEFAVIAARRSQIEPLAQSGSWAAKVALRAMERASFMLATSQLGITVCSIMILSVSEPAIHHLIEGLLYGTPLPKEVISVSALIAAILIVTVLHVVIGEMVPKNLAIALPERSALLLSPVLYTIAMAIKPIVSGLNAVSNAILRLFKFEPKDEANTSYTLDQVEDIVEHSTREGSLADVSGTLTNTFEFTEKKVSDVAIPIAKLISFSENVTPREVEQAVAKHGFSRYPLTDESNELVGYLHLKDVIDLDLDEVDDPFPAKRIRTLISLPATMELEDALASMRRVHAHMAKSFDARGNVLGVLFLEDILEELVGEVHDATRR